VLPYGGTEKNGCVFTPYMFEQLRRAYRAFLSIGTCRKIKKSAALATSPESERNRQVAACKIRLKIFVVGKTCFPSGNISWLTVAHLIH